MIAVAVVAVLLGSGLQCRQWWFLSREYAETAAHYAGLEVGERAAVAVYEANVAEMSQALVRLDPLGPEAAALRRRFAKEKRVLAITRACARHSGTVRTIYTRAARWPWLPVEPSPPWPE
jgi:hypothetical protein